jgi:dihydrofolate synthase/folylpolyglutamate synthase
VPAIFGRQETEATRALAHAGPSYREGDAWHYHPGKVTLDVTFDGTTRRMALPPLAGEHQCHNAALAVVAMQVLGLKTPRDSLRAARWPGRLQQLTRGPLVKAWGAPLWLDGAHNAHAARALAEWARQQPGLRMLVCGLLARKDADAFFEALGDAFDAIVTIPVPGTTDAHTARHLAALAGPRAHAAASWEGVMAQLRRYQPATVVIAGSLYLAGAILKYHE